MSRMMQGALLALVPVSLMLGSCGAPVSSTEQGARRTGFDQRGNRVPRYIMEDPNYTQNPRYWDRNGDFIAQEQGPSGGFDERRWEREQMEDEIRHRRFLEYIRECAGCTPEEKAAAERAAEKMSKAR